MDQVDRFGNDVRNAEVKIAGCERTVEGLRPHIDQRLRWDIDHQFPDSRLRGIDAELADLGHSPDLSLSRDASLFRRAPGTAHPAWFDQLAEVTPPALPGRDMGAGTISGRDADPG